MENPTRYEEWLKEKDDLTYRLNDLEYLIQVREEELAQLRSAAAGISELNSRISMNLLEMEQMQRLIGDQQHQAAGAARREASLEEELLLSVAQEKALYDLRQEFRSVTAELDFLTTEWQAATACQKELADARARIRQLESELELTTLDQGFLREELDTYRQSPTTENPVE